MDHCEVLGDQILLHILIRNLVDNAARYSGPGSQIVTYLSIKDGRFSLSVEDSGPGINSEERAKLGARFYRKSGMTQAGSGLGWSICERICAVHGFTLSASRSTTLGGFRAGVQGPGKDSRRSQARINR